MANVDSVSDYKSDFILFPEYFNAPLMARFNDLGEAQSIRKIPDYSINFKFIVIKTIPPIKAMHDGSSTK